SFDPMPGQGHDVSDVQPPGAPRPLDGRWLGDVVEPPVGPLDEEVAPIPELIGEPSADDAPRDARAGLDGGDDEGHAGVRQVAQVARPALDDVAGELRLAEGRLHRRPEPPRPGTDLLGESQPHQELEASDLVETGLLSIPGPRTRSLVGHEPLGVGAPEQGTIDLRELHPLDRLAPGGQVLPLVPETEDSGRLLLAAGAESG